MNSILTVARYSMLRSRRDKAFFLTLGAGILGLVLLAGVAGPGAVTQARLTLEFGIVYVEIVTLAMGITLLVSTAPADFSGGGLQIFLARPLGRAQYLLGRWLGLGAAMFCNFALLGWLLGGVLWHQGDQVAALLETASLSMLKLILFSTLLMVLAVRLPAYLGALIAVLAWFVMHITDMLAGALATTGVVFVDRSIQTAISLIPDFGHFSLQYVRVAGGTPPSDYLFGLVGYTFLYMLLFLFMAIVSLGERDL